jgi:hypothetical protein
MGATLGNQWWEQNDMADLTIPEALRTVDRNERHSTAVSQYRSLKHDTDLNHSDTVHINTILKLGEKGGSV